VPMSTSRRTPARQVSKAVLRLITFVTLGFIDLSIYLKVEKFQNLNARFGLRYLVSEVFLEMDAVKRNYTQVGSDTTLFPGTARAGWRPALPRV